MSSSSLVWKAIILTSIQRLPFEKREARLHQSSAVSAEAASQDSPRGCRWCEITGMSIFSVLHV